MEMAKEVSGGGGGGGAEGDNVDGDRLEEAIENRGKGGRRRQQHRD